MNNITYYIDNLINDFYIANGDYPTKIIMSLDCYDKLIILCKEQNLNNSWLDFSIKNYKGILIDIEEIMDIKLI